MVFHKCLHSLVAGQSEIVIALRGLTVAIFGTLPEQTLIVAQERGTLHLALVAQDGVSFLTQFLWTHGYAHLNVGHVPLGPGTTIHPYTTVVQPLVTGFLYFVDGCENGIGTLTVCAVRIGQVGSYIDLVDMGSFSILPLS